MLAGDFRNDTLTSDAISKSLQLAADTASLLDLASRIHKLTGESEKVASVLDMAEEAVSTLEDMRKLANAVNQLASDDETRVNRVKAKLEKREASQAKYVAFQEREKALSRPAEFMSLAQEVVDELEDKFYAGHLLETAQELLDAQPFILQHYQALIQAVDSLVGDADWVKRMLDKSAEQVAVFMQLQSLGRTAATELADKDFGAQWARSLYKRWEEKLLGNQNVVCHDLSKLARAVHHDLNDADWALTLLTKARDHARSHLELAWLGHFARDWGEADAADRYYKDAAGLCGDSDQYRQLVRQLRSFGETAELQRALYSEGEKALSDPLQKLRWAEGIVAEFHDRAWAAQVYEGLKDQLQGPDVQDAYERSRNRWLDQGSRKYTDFSGS